MRQQCSLQVRRAISRATMSRTDRSEREGGYFGVKIPESKKKSKLRTKKSIRLTGQSKKSNRFRQFCKCRDRTPASVLAAHPQVSLEDTRKCPDRTPASYWQPATLRGCDTLATMPLCPSCREEIQGSPRRVFMTTTDDRRLRDLLGGGHRTHRTVLRSRFLQHVRG
eukprot:COSAG05_NODE_696_length_7879_cov_9.218895_2_plen_167_part_00